MSFVQYILLALSKAKDFFIVYNWIFWLAFGLFLFFKIFKGPGRIKKRFHDFWEDLFLSKLDHCLLEIRIPNALEKTPLAMEQVFAGLHGTSKGVTKYEVEMKGYLETSYSLELASIEGRIHFYIRGERKHRTTMEALLYAQFPEIEIQEVEDYTQNCPKDMPNDDHSLACGEFILEKPGPYPIRTYQQFELRAGREAEYVVDPFAAVLEAMNALGEGEQMWLHYVAGIPMLSDWQAEGREMIGKLMGREEEKIANKGMGIIRRLIREIFLFEPHVRKHAEHFVIGGEYQMPEEDPFTDDIIETHEKSIAESGFFRLSPGEREVCLAIEKNITKLGFYTMIRFAYFAPTEIFNSAKAETLIGSFLQFNDKTLNSFGINQKIKYTVKRPYLWEHRKVNYYLAWKHRILPITRQRLRVVRTREIFKYFKNRGFGKPDRGHKGLILSTEELATIFHFPMKSVLTPELPRVEAKRGGPPDRLPIG